MSSLYDASGRLSIDVYARLLTHYHDIDKIPRRKRTDDVSAFYEYLLNEKFQTRFHMIEK